MIVLIVLIGRIALVDGITVDRMLKSLNPARLVEPDDEHMAFEAMAEAPFGFSVRGIQPARKAQQFLDSPRAHAHAQTVQLL